MIPQYQWHLLAIRNLLIAQITEGVLSFNSTVAIYVLLAVTTKLCLELLSQKGAVVSFFWMIWGVFGIVETDFLML